MFNVSGFRNLKYNYPALEWAQELLVALQIRWQELLMLSDIFKTSEKARGETHWFTSRKRVASHYFTDIA